MKDILTFAKDNYSSFERGSVSSNEIYFFEYKGRKYVLKANPYIPVAPFVAADDEAMIFEYVEGSSEEEEEFPAGKENAYRLGQFVGCNHRNIHKNCGIIGIEDVTDFFSTDLI